MFARLLRRVAGRRWGQVLLLLGAAGMVGCASEEDLHPKKTAYIISAPQSEFYKYGPAQAFGPDQALIRGEKVTLLQRQFGYSHIMLASGVSGYVATEDLAPAPPPLPTPKPISLASAGRPAKRGGSQAQPSAAPFFDVNDVPLPSEPEKPHPSFRSNLAPRQ